MTGRSRKRATTSLPNVTRRLLSAAIGLLAGAGCQKPPPPPPPPQWHAEQHYRWRELVIGPGEVGFTVIDPSVSGIRFANQVPDSAILTNRILVNGAGVAMGDVDGDGRLDIFFGRTLGRSVLYRNLGDWKFEDVTESSGLGTLHVTTGVVFADADGDRDLDLFLNALGGPNHLYLNDGKGRFTSDPDYPGLQSRYGSVTSTLADVEGDGDLDLYVANHKPYTIADKYPASALDIATVTRRTPDGRLELKEEYAADLRLIKTADDTTFEEAANPGFLYLNDGAGRFDVAPMANSPRFLDEQGRQFPTTPEQFSLSARFYDVNGDRAPELYVANDFEDPDQFWINDGHGNFRAVDHLAQRTISRSGMGVDFADIDRDGLVDIYEVDMLSLDSRGRHTQMPAQRPKEKIPGVLPDRPQFMRNTMFLNRGDGTFAQIAELSGLDASGWTWSTLFMDVDLDGYEDILTANGHKWDEADADTYKKFSGNMASYKVGTAGYPPLKLRNYLFRNRGDLTFEEVGERWRFGTEPDISLAMAVGDLDDDGDLDAVLSRLDQPALVLRNEGTAPRIAVRLEGNPPNTRAVGAKVRVLGGPVPIQEREVTAGGIYLSHSDYLLSFGTGSADSVTIEVQWRDGSLSTIPGARPNRIYEIAQSGARPGSDDSVRQSPPPLFADASSTLNHTHFDPPFPSELYRQPLLSNTLAEMGPGVTWTDLDRDGSDDLVITSGRTDRFAWFQNSGGRFVPRQLLSRAAGDLTTALWVPLPGGGGRLVVGQSNYEAIEDHGVLPVALGFGWTPSGHPKGTVETIIGPDTSSVGPLAMADVDGDGTLDLFLGSRVIPAEYPKAGGSRLYRQTASGGFVLDSANVATLSGLGMVSSAVFADLDHDADPDLILAIEWGPITVLLNERGLFRRAGPAWGFDTSSSRWLGVTVGDFDEDGQLDIVSTSLGRNVRFAPDSTNPQILYYGNFDQGFSLDLLLAQYDERLQGIGPLTGYRKLIRGVPSMEQRVGGYGGFADLTVEQLLGTTFRAVRSVKATTFEHLLWLNRGNTFEPRPLPIEAQLTASFAPVVADFDGDGHEDLALSQNFIRTERVEPAIDAGRGLILLGDGRGWFRPLSGQASGVLVYGDQRGAAAGDYDRDGRTDLVITQNAMATRLFRNVGGRPGVRVRLKGPPGNPDGVGAEVRLTCDGKAGPIRLAGATSYWSMNSPVVVLAPTNDGPCTVEVQWPNGKASSARITKGQREVTIAIPTD